MFIGFEIEGAGGGGVGVVVFIDKTAGTGSRDLGYPARIARKSNCSTILYGTLDGGRLIIPTAKEVGFGIVVVRLFTNVAWL